MTTREVFLRSGEPIASNVSQPPNLTSQRYVDMAGSSASDTNRDRHPRARRNSHGNSSLSQLSSSQESRRSTRSQARLDAVNESASLVLRENRRTNPRRKATVAFNSIINTVVTRSPSAEDQLEAADSLLTLGREG